MHLRQNHVLGGQLTSSSWDPAAPASNERDSPEHPNEREHDSGTNGQRERWPDEKHNEVHYQPGQASSSFTTLSSQLLPAAMHGVPGPPVKA